MFKNKLDNLFIYKTILFFVMITFFSCSFQQEKGVTGKDEFFAPISKDRVKPKIYDSRIVDKSDQGIKDTIIQMLRIQSRRLDDVVFQLNQLTKKEFADNSLKSDNLSDYFSSRENTKNVSLIEIIQKQNQRINDLIEQLKLLAKSQSYVQSNYSAMVARVEATPIEQPPLRKVVTTRQSGEVVDYAKAIQFYKDGNYDKAISSFRYLLRNGITRNLEDNCHFWVGVSYFNQRKMKQAIESFNKVLSYSDSDKIEETHFMMGQCYELIGAKKQALEIFEKMIINSNSGKLRPIVEKKIALLK